MKKILFKLLIEQDCYPIGEQIICGNRSWQWRITKLENGWQLETRAKPNGEFIKYGFERNLSTLIRKRIFEVHLISY